VGRTRRSRSPTLTAADAHLRALGRYAQGHNDLGTDLTDLVQKELRLARTEIVQKLTFGLQAGAWFAIAAVLGIFAVLLILEALVFGIAGAGLPLWGSCLLVAFLLSALVAIAFFYARRQSSEEMTPVSSARQFTRAIGTVKEQLR